MDCVPESGQTERINRAIKEGEADRKTIRGVDLPLNIKRYHYDSHKQLERHLRDFVAAYELGRRLKTSTA